MEKLSIPDRAALLVAKRAEVEAAIAKVRNSEGDWQVYQLLMHDILNGLHESLCQATTMLQRVHDLADDEAARLRGAKP